MRLISASLTKDQIRQSVELVRQGKAPVKDVTRRVGWRDVRFGERLQVCEKVMGRRKGDPLVRICVIEVVSRRLERLDRMGSLKREEGFGEYGVKELHREGFGMCHPIAPNQTIRTTYSFIKFFCETHKGCAPSTKITRIEFKYILCSFGVPGSNAACGAMPSWVSTFKGKPTQLFWCNEHKIEEPYTTGHGCVPL